MAEKIYAVSLGCARNLVDTELMLGRVVQDGYELTPSIEEASIALVNTCSFIQSAKEEAIQTILETAEYKKRGNLKTLVVAGCLPQRYGRDLAELIPEVDLLIGTGEVFQIGKILKKRSTTQRVFVGLPRALYDETAPRLITTAPHSAYLKISEGCNHHCAFCIIPTLRGKTRSRPVPALVTEAARLASSGVKEINLVAEDLTAYGRDLHDGTTLSLLLKELSRVEGVEWLRLLYAYPNLIDRELLGMLRDEDRICRYLDVPLQHASDRILQRMKRERSVESLKRLIRLIRDEVPGIVLRTTFIVGFPGETEDDFLALKDFVAETEFDHVGVFRYSREEGTEADRLDNHVPEEVKERRWHDLMRLQRKISRKKNHALIGQFQKVIICEVDHDGTRVMAARSERQAPDVDGVIWIRGASVQVGELRQVRVTGATDYDLSGEVL
jgi:ribosomal protein S12 methylthiotransferase